MRVSRKVKPRNSSARNTVKSASEVYNKTDWKMYVYRDLLYQIVIQVQNCQESVFHLLVTRLHSTDFYNCIFIESETQML